MEEKKDIEELIVEIGETRKKLVEAIKPMLAKKRELEADLEKINKILSRVPGLVVRKAIRERHFTGKVVVNEKEDWLKKLSWFVMRHMGDDEAFCDAFAGHFTDEEVQEFDKLTDELFEKKDFDFSWWITIYPDLMDTYNCIPHPHNEAMRFIVEEMFRRGFKLSRKVRQDE